MLPLGQTHTRNAKADDFKHKLIKALEKENDKEIRHKLDQNEKDIVMPNNFFERNYLANQTRGSGSDTGHKYWKT